MLLVYTTVHSMGACMGVAYLGFVCRSPVAWHDMISIVATYSVMITALGIAAYVSTGKHTISNTHPLHIIVRIHSEAYIYSVYIAAIYSNIVNGDLLSVQYYVYTAIWLLLYRETPEQTNANPKCCFNNSYLKVYSVFIRRTL